MGASGCRTEAAYALLPVLGPAECWSLAVRILAGWLPLY